MRQKARTRIRNPGKKERRTKTSLRIEMSDYTIYTPDLTLPNGQRRSLCPLTGIRIRNLNKKLDPDAWRDLFYLNKKD